MTAFVQTDIDLFSFFEHTPDLVCIAGKEGYFRKVNGAVASKLKYTPEQLMQHPISYFIHPEDKEYTARRRKELLQGKALVNFENRYLTSEGETVWLHWTSLYFPEKEVVFAIAKDVTERKRKEKAIEEKYLQVAGLATHFKNRLENDRKYLAAELHEELAQIASAVRVDLGWLSGESSGLGKEVQHRLAHALSATEMLINSIRRLSYSIGASMLEEVGFYETMQWLCDETALLLEAPCRFEWEGEEAHIPAELWVDLFRIGQEILGCLQGLEPVEKVWVTLAQQDGSVFLSVRVQGAVPDHEGFLEALEATGVQPWVASISGQLRIYRKNPKDVEIRIRVPAGLQVSSPSPAGS